MNVLGTPVAIFVFNRPDITSKVFSRIREARPTRLLVVADGPRPGKEGESALCDAVRKICTSNIDWECSVQINFSDHNLGCKRRMSSGLDWVFEQTSRAIILEDDCYPALSFFEFCDELLNRFATDTRVMQICGTNVDESASPEEFSYAFSKYGPIWGWASWSRAWKAYDVEMKYYLEAVDSGTLKNLWELPGEGEYRTDLYRRILSGELDTWDLQWGFAKYINSGLSIIPSKNLITNLGYGSDATHTANSSDPMAGRPTTDLIFPLRHYPMVVRHRGIDRAFHEKMTPEKYRSNDSRTSK